MRNALIALGSTVAAATVVALVASLVPACSSSDDVGTPAETPDAGACTSLDFDGAPLGIHCNALVDDVGRTVLLHGINARVGGVFDVTFSDGRAPLEPVPDFTKEDAARIRALGFNALRLPINWSAIEPTETGGFDEAYMKRVDAAIALAADEGLFVLVDLHQDAYSKEIGEDGAPLWAISPPPTTLLGGPLGDLDARRLSQQVSDAFTTFFGPSADGVRLRGRFAAMLSFVAKRYAASVAVIGFEIYNEPLAGDSDLLAFDHQMIDAIHVAAPRKLVFFEPSATRNLLDQATIGAASLGIGTVYAPHVYTLAFRGTDEQKNGLTKETLRPSNARAREEADGFAAPMVVTEFGFSPAAPNFASYVEWQSELQDEQLASGFLWLWKEDSQGGWGFFDFAADGTTSERAAVVQAVTRVRLEKAPGRLVSVGYDPSARRFEARYVSDAAGTGNPSARVFVGDALGAGVAAHATCDGHDALGIPGPAPGTLDVVCGGAGSHTLVVSR